MNWARVSSISIAVAVALVIIANAPAILMDPLYLAVAQIRVNAATSQSTAVPVPSSETTPEIVTSVKKAK